MSDPYPAGAFLCRQLGGAEIAGVPAANPPRIVGMFLRGRPVPSPGCEPLGVASPKALPVPLPPRTEQPYGEPWEAWPGLSWWRFS